MKPKGGTVQAKQVQLSVSSVIVEYGRTGCIFNK
jgi:hypothetical protein